MPRIPVEVYVIAKKEGQVSIFYSPLGIYSDARPVEVTYPLDIFPQAAKLETGMKRAITLHPELLKKTQF
jgi:hypothetical protein